jgi:site-specific DNA-methyltransferase (adenine-specific)
MYEQRWTNFVNTKKTNHPTEKPIELYNWLLKNYAQEGFKILDTHLGSGSIAVACHYAGYDLVASELDKEYFDAAKKFIKDNTRQTSLF